MKTKMTLSLTVAFAISAFAAIPAAATGSGHDTRNIVVTQTGCTITHPQPGQPDIVVITEDGRLIENYGRRGDVNNPDDLKRVKLVCRTSPDSLWLIPSDGPPLEAGIRATGFACEIPYMSGVDATETKLRVNKSGWGRMVCKADFRTP